MTATYGGERLGRTTATWAQAVPWTLAGAGVLAQIAFPLTDGGTFALTVAAVVLLASASLSHALVSRGPAAAVALLAVAGGGGFVAEAVGVRTGFPFGAYDYTGTLGAEVLGVPVLVPLAWTMMAWPALAVARLLVGHRSRWVVVVVGAWALTAWDVFLDPQMVDAGHWRWADPDPALPGVEGIPVTNFLGWLVVSLVIVAVLDRLVTRAPRSVHHPHRPDHADGPTHGRGGRRAAPPPCGGPSRGAGAVVTGDLLPLVVYAWTYLSSIAAHAVFFGRPPVALVGGLLMGLVGVPLLIRLARLVPDPRARLR